MPNPVVPVIFPTPKARPGRPPASAPPRKPLEPKRLIDHVSIVSLTTFVGFSIAVFAHAAMGMAMLAG